MYIDHKWQVSTYMQTFNHDPLTDATEFHQEGYDDRHHRNLTELSSQVFQKYLSISDIQTQDKIFVQQNNTTSKIAGLSL